jgi:hypothetical protein
MRCIVTEPLKSKLEVAGFQIDTNTDLSSEENWE